MVAEIVGFHIDTGKSDTRMQMTTRRPQYQVLHCRQAGPDVGAKQETRLRRSTWTSGQINLL